MSMTYRNPFLEYDPADPYREYQEEEDMSTLRPRTSRTQAGHDPGMWLEPNRSHMLQRNGGGGGFSLGPDPEETQGEIETVQPAGVKAKDSMLSKVQEARMDAAQWGSEDPDSDRVAPQDIDTSNKGSMDSSAQKADEKPPGPDSPSPFMKDYEQRKKAYDEEFGPGKKHKWYSLESTEAWERRRASAQYDLERARQEASDVYQRTAERAPHAAGGAMQIKVGGKKKVILPMTDGSYRTVIDSLDDEAEKTTYSDTVYTAADGRQYKVESGGTGSRWISNPDAGQPMPNGTQGPQGPHMSKWVTPEKSHELSRGEKLVSPSGETIAEGTPVPPPQGRASAKTPPTLEEEALKYAESQWKPNKDFDSLEPETQASVKDEFIEREKQAYMRRRQGKGEAPKSATGKNRRTVPID